MLFSAAVVLSAVASALAGVHVESGSKYSDRKLVARSDVKSPNGNIHVQFEFVGTKDGEPTFVKIRGLKGLTNDPSLNGPFAYHIHTNPVPADGNCTKTLAHLDPLDVTTGFTCNPNFPQYCESGDLSGKHGKLVGTSDGKIATFGYSDAYVRFFPEPHSILGRSVVIHSADKTRIACGNIISPLDGTAKDSWKPTGKPSKYVKNYPTAAPPSPGPPVAISNGTEAPDQSKLPYRLPIPALSLAEAVNVNLTTITHTVKIAGVDQTVTQPKEFKIDGTGPFKGEKKDDCDW